MSPNYDTWREHAEAELKRRYKIEPSSIRERVWRNSYFRGMTPVEAAEHAEVTYVNSLTVLERRHYHLIRERSGEQR